ncbi:MAG: N-acetylmuramoyl-L-alanine amidase [Chloroflexota bacterium]
MPAPAQARHRERVGAVLLLAALLLAAPVAPTQGLRAAEPAPVGLVAAGSPLVPGAGGPGAAIRITVTLAAPATVDLAIAGWYGRTVATLAAGVPLDAGTHTWRWAGRDPDGDPVPPGAYQVRVVATGPDGSVEEGVPIAVATTPLSVPAPGAIVVALNPGHGGPDPGAVYGGRTEAEANLAIGRELAAMLTASGIRVVVTRDRDVAVNRPRSDVTGNGTTDHTDELVARNDIANSARADVFVTLMNNAYGCHCVHGTETYTSRERTWTPEGVRLARLIQAAHLRHLAPFRSRAWRPVDRGVRFWHFASIRPWQPRLMPRPALMPSVLVESLFMDHPPELRVLSRPAARSALAAAYFEGIARFLSERTRAARIEVPAPPTDAPAGSAIDVPVRVRNTGTAAARGWTLEARIVQADGPYHARPVRGVLVGSAPVADGLAPGATTDVLLADLPLPPGTGDFTLLLDIRDRTSRTVADRGVPRAQWTIRLTGSAPAVAGPGADGILRLPQGRAWAAWRASLPRDPLGPAALRPRPMRWRASAPALRGVRPVDIPPDSAAGMAGVYGDDHPH